jgi:hypothetical protein
MIKKPIRFLSCRTTVKSIGGVADHAARIAIKSMEIHIAESAMNQTEGKIIKIEKN